MTGDILNTELKAFSTGDKSREKLLCSMLAAHPLWVVLAEHLPDVIESAAPKIRVFLEPVQGKQTAFVFTTENFLKTWCAETQRSGQALQLFGADLSLTLPQGTMVCVDPTSHHEVVVEARQLQEGGIPQVKPASANAGEVPKKFIPRSSPTTFFAPPKLKLSEPEDDGPMAARPRTFTSSNLKKVIRPPSSRD